jgi:N-acetylneuraminic acid mutarotase
MPQALTGGGAVSVNGKIYFMCGSSNYVYDPTADIWALKSSMPTPRTVFGIVEYQGKIFVIGGTNSDGTNVNVNEVYDPSNDTWTTLAPMPTARTGIEANAVNGKIYVMGGENYSGYINFLFAFPQNEIYNIATNSWSTGKPKPYPVYAYSSAVVNTKIYYLGGANHVSPNNLTQIYDPQKDSWTFGANFSMSMMATAAAATTGAMAPQRIYLFGGTSDEPLAGENNTQVYDPASNTWINGTVMPSGRSSMAAAGVDDLIYVIGGNPTFLTVTGENEQYTPFGYGTPQPTSTSTVPEFSTSFTTVALLITTAAAIVFTYKKRHV